MREAWAYIVNVAVLAVAAQANGVGGVLEVEEDEARGARVLAGTGTDGDAVVQVLVDDHVVTGADGEVGEVAGDVALGVENDGSVAGVDVEKLCGLASLVSSYLKYYWSFILLLERRSSSFFDQRRLWLGLVRLTLVMSKIWTPWFSSSEPMSM